MVCCVHFIKGYQICITLSLLHPVWYILWVYIFQNNPNERADNSLETEIPLYFLMEIRGRR